MKAKFIYEAFEQHKSKEEAIKKLHEQPWDVELHRQIEEGHLIEGYQINVDFGPWKNIFLDTGYDQEDPEHNEYNLIIIAAPTKEDHTKGTNKNDHNKEKKYFEQYGEYLIKSMHNGMLGTVKQIVLSNNTIMYTELEEYLTQQDNIDLKKRLATAPYDSKRETIIFSKTEMWDRMRIKYDYKNRSMKIFFDHLIPEHFHDKAVEMEKKFFEKFKTILIEELNIPNSLWSTCTKIVNSEGDVLYSKINETFDQYKSKAENRRKLLELPWDVELVKQLETGVDDNDVRAHVNYGPWKDIFVYEFWDLSQEPGGTYLSISGGDAKKEREYFENYKKELITAANALGFERIKVYCTQIRGDVGDVVFWTKKEE
jgi:hypothetical protein